MLLSMTGFGQASGNYKNKTITIELKSLNGKTTDIRCRLPNNYREKEILLRKQIMDKAFRGKMDINLIVSSEDGSEDFSLNKPLFKRYIKELTALQSEAGLPASDFMPAILRLPNVVGSEEVQISDEEWKVVSNLTEESLSALNEFRKEEGAAMLKDFIERINSIMDALSKIEPFEEIRIVKLKERLQRNLQEFVANEKVDQNRFEQEIIYYMEKLDINEEKVRLSQHCRYFMDVLESNDLEKGKKLGFISQEIGREINTLGAKAQDSDIQRYVVLMKEELEKVKEQVLNVI